MTVYEKNLEALAKYYPGMDIIIEKAKKELKPELEILEEISYEGEKILKIIKKGKCCYLNGKRETKEPARIWVETLGILQRNATVCMVGVGNASYLDELVEKIEKRLTIIVYEPSLQIFLKFLEMQEIEEWMKKHLIIFWVDGLKDMDDKHMREILGKVLSYEMLEYSKNFILPNYDILFAEKVRDFFKICRDIALGQLMRFNTNKTFSGIMVKNLFSNAKYLCNGYKTTQLPSVIPTNIPGILVAAGPSLNKNINELRKAKGKAFIIAVDTAIKPLLNADIMPDMFAIVDGMKPLELVKIKEARNIPLLTTLNAAPEILDYHTGMKFFYNEGYQFAEKILLKTGQMIGEVSCGGSVATSIFSLLYKIGLTTIILVGQDLAYTDNKSHADGTFQEVMQQVDTSRFRYVEGNYEDKVPTRSDFKIFLDWYNQYIAGCKEYCPDLHVINATEGGAKINNTQIMTLKEAIEQECTKQVNIQECLQKLEPMLNEENKRWAIEYLRNMPDRFFQLKNEATKLKELYKRLGVICNNKHIDREKYLKIYKKIGNQVQILESNSVYQLVEITMNNAQYILRNEQFLEEDSVQEEGKEIARKGILYMDNVIKMADTFEEYAKEVFLKENFLEEL